MVLIGFILERNYIKSLDDKNRPKKFHTFNSRLQPWHCCPIFSEDVSECWTRVKTAGAGPPSVPSMCNARRGSYSGFTGVSQQIARSMWVSGFLHPKTGPNFLPKRFASSRLNWGIILWHLEYFERMTNQS